MPTEESIFLPPQYVVNGKVLGNPVVQLQQPAYRGLAQVEKYSKHGMHGTLISTGGEGQDERDVLIMPRPTQAEHPVDSILVVPGGTVPERPSDLHNLSGNPRWIEPAPTTTRNIVSEELIEAAHQVQPSWEGRFHFKEERQNGNGEMEGGLRPPQIGALYAALAHWTIGSEPATVVMPTGTGKTETMLAAMAHESPERLLVIVPTSALRDQIAGKFITWGILKQFGILEAGAEYPLVGKLEHTLDSADEVIEYFACCNVVVATMAVLRHCSKDVRQAISEACSHLFIDEAHHIAATSWEAFRRLFLESGDSKPVLQFTATPYRSDGKHVDGRIIYNFPLRNAQNQGYFAPIQFRPIREYRPSEKDASIARKAVGQLWEDLGENYDHILMARASSIPRAEEIHEEYAELAPDLNPVVVHSRQSKTDQQQATDALFNRESRIVVCVDMFGEGFDLPQLKIAALHDVHKSLGVTIQFTGRFARSTEELGDATVIANIADADVEEAIQNLYAEDPDWNHLLRHLTEEETERQRERSEFFDTFDLPDAFPVQNIFPKMSTVAYRAERDVWQPHGIGDGIPSRHELYSDPVVSQAHNTAVFVTKFETPVDWGDIRGFTDVTWHLYVLHWNPGQGILYINSSNNNSVHKRLAAAVCGEESAIVRGEQVFRALDGINRLRFMNIGLNHAISRTVTHTMYAGANVSEGLTEAQVQNKFKTNLFGHGYEDGERASVGCSRKGRMWSYRVADDVQEWTDWCQHVGAKLLNDDISVRGILQNAMRVEVMEERPQGVPVAIEWSEALYLRSEERTHFEIDGERTTFLNVGIELLHHEEDTPLRFAVFTDEKRIEYEVLFGEEDVQYAPMGEEEASIRIGYSVYDLTDWFQEEPPLIRFADTSYLQYNEFFQVPEDRYESYHRDRIEVWDWSGVDITTESQYKHVKQNGDSKLIGRLYSIQRRVIETLQDLQDEDQYDVIVDDDDSGEIADIVALRLADDELAIHLFHCKYSSEETPGARVGDLHAVCGQAQRSVYWKSNPRGLIEHLKSRAGDRLDKYETSRFEAGDFERLEEIIQQLPFVETTLKVFVVQPGLDVDGASEDQLDLLASTELFLQETYAAEFRVIGS